ncbi:MAG: hypothetical protein JSS87_11170 [Acidobacteria bacterium]|nr:hypothetical protein [Acidobacteriota bacterium]
MFINALRTCTALAVLATASAAYAGGPSIKTERTGGLKGKSTVAIGAFRVIWVRQDSIGASSTNNFGGGLTGRATVEQEAFLLGLEKPQMQKLTDQIYADFLTKLKAKGYTVIEPKDLLAKAPQAASLEMTENFETGRWGTYVVPSGQSSIQLAADESKAVGRGSKGGVFSGFKQQGQKTKKGEADKVLPEASKAIGDTPVIGVTIVASFAQFKGSGYSHWGQSAKTKIMTGATINGAQEKQDAMVTGIQVWDAHMYDNCKIACPLSTLALVGDIHDEHSVGEMVKYDAKTHGERITNAFSDFTGDAAKHKGYIVNLDPAAYDQNMPVVAAQANDLLVASLAKER